MVVQTEQRHLDGTYRQMLMNQSATAFTALQEFHSGRLSLERAQGPIQLYRQMLRLGPEHVELMPGFPPRIRTGPAPGADSGDDVTVRAREERPTPIINQGEPGAGAIGIDGLGDRNRSLSPEGDNWVTLRSTLTPDPLPPSVSSSFASVAASQTTGNTSQTDLTRMSELFAGAHSHDGVHECDGSCIDCPEHYLDDEDDDLLDEDPDLVRETDAELRGRWRAQGRHIMHIHDILRRARATQMRVDALATRFNLDRVEP
jgi:hypothetical protein